MDHFLREELSKLLMKYSYRTIDESLRLIVNDMKKRFDSDFAVINMPCNEEVTHTIIPVDDQMNMDLELLGVKSMQITEPKKRILKKKPKT